ncbi:hypothetical protein EIP86_005021 [Pleurotus ostreatoroseus]|nr:hypothetical protein EIP86_005021 [Pleurotus ostreatoroseus]
MWRFKLGTLNVLKKLEDCADPITKILLCQQYQLDALVWLIPSAEALAQRNETLSAIEGERLGWNNAMKIAKIRERYSCCCHGGEYWTKDPRGAMRITPNCCKREKYSFHMACRDAFKVDLKLNPGVDDNA